MEEWRMKEQFEVFKFENLSKDNLNTYHGGSNVNRIKFICVLNILALAYVLFNFENIAQRILPILSIIVSISIYRLIDNIKFKEAKSICIVLLVFTGVIAIIDLYRTSILGYAVATYYFGEWFAFITYLTGVISFLLSILIYKSIKLVGENKKSADKSDWFYNS